ncbi:MAG: SpoIIE family protein phosphatase [Clostridia bacterium]|nr:SpoIIE family protein phosphatase [Clostridia bacterium]
MQEEQIKTKKGRKKDSALSGGRQTASAALWRSRLRACVQELVWGCVAWIFGQASLLFGTYPLGLALLCGTSGHTAAILTGLVITTVTNLTEPTVYVCTYFAAALIRVLASMLLDEPDTRFSLPEELRQRIEDAAEEADEIARTETRLSRMRRRVRTAASGEKKRVLWQEVRDIFRESIFLRMTTAAICALILGLYTVFHGGFAYYDWFAAAFLVLFCPVAVMVYAAALEERESVHWLRRVSEAALLFSLVFAARSVAFLTLPLSPMIALFFALYVTHTRTPVSGCVAGVIGGVGYSPLHAPAFLLAALVYQLLMRRKRENAAVLAAVMAALGWLAYIDGILYLSVLLPSVLLTGTVFGVLQKLLLRADGSAREEVASEESGVQMDTTRYKDANDRFRGISDAFSSLSEVFYNLSDRFRRPGTLDLRRICDDSFDRFCADCPNKTVCWGLEYSETLSEVNELIAHLHTKGRVSSEQISERLLHRCGSVSGILEQINRECARLTGEMLRNNRTEIFAMDYESAAAIINDALEEDDGEYRFDPELERRVMEYLGDAGVKSSGVTVYGKRRRRILIRGAELEHAKVTFETLRSDLGELCGSELGTPTFEVENNVTTMILQAGKKLSVAGAQNNVAADGGVSGDTVNLFSNKQDYFYALISDGMGSGKEAALTSGLCSVFLEKMLRAGNRAGTSLRMLNNMICSRSADSARECSSTVDLLELDLMTGEGRFIKSGAAPSFVIRGNMVQRLQAGTVPIGIIGTLDAQTTVCPLHEGDIVVMISDGILQSDPDCRWITSYLAGVREMTPEEIVYQICLHAAESEQHDDCSAIALRIEKKEE